MRNFYEFMALRFYCIVLVLVLYACSQKGETTAPGLGARYDNESDLEKAGELGKEIYAKIASADSVTIYKLFEPELKDDFHDFMDLLRQRELAWGKLQSWKITEKTSYVSANDDTTRFEITINALYDENESSDVITLEKIGKKPFELTYYDFSARVTYDCGADALEKLKPQLKQNAEAMVFGYENKLKQIAGNDKPFYDSLLRLSRDNFPQGTTLDSIVFEDGYLREYCGIDQEAKGIAVFKIYMNETDFQYCIFKINREKGEHEYNVYEVILDGELEVDGTNDVDIAKRISKDVCQIIHENNHEKFFTTFHSELKELYADGDMEELKGVVEDFASLGKFYDYYDWHVYRTKDDSFVYFIMVIQLINDEDELHYLEMTFKPDKNGKYMLVSCHELTY